MTTIGFIADNFFPSVQRGAELEDKILIEEAERRGHNITRISKLTKQVNQQTDLYVLANFVDTFNIGELLGYLSRKPYIHIEHDLRAPHCPWYYMVAQDALINVYHSPLQEQLIKQLSGEYKHFLHPMCIPDSFRDLGLPRQPETEVLYVGDYSWEKGYKEMVEWLEQPENTDKKIHHYGLGFPMKHERMVEHGSLPQEKMPELYNRYYSLIFLPHYPQACSRILAEAYLCKVPNIITNDKDGFSSYGWTMDDYDSVRFKLTNGHKLFWNKIEEVIENVK